MEIQIMQNLLAANSAKATELRQLLRKHGICMINLISAPGSGKTALLAQSLPLLQQHYRVAVIEGDVESDRDVQRLEQYGVPLALINTNGACHLEAVSIAQACAALDFTHLDLILVENVGNLVCPAEFDIGEDLKVALVSTPEGDDKPLKYPLLFREASLVILNKIDLLPYLDFALHNFYAALRKLNPDLGVIETACPTQVGIAAWVAWVGAQLAHKRTTLAV